MLEPALPVELTEASDRLRFRSTLLVYLFVDKGDLGPHQAIYVIDPHVGVGRVANYANWSPAMRTTTTRTAVSCEYWCSLGDATWTQSDEDLISLATADLRKMGLLGAARV